LQPVFVFLEVIMRSYEAARSLFGFLSFLSWVVIIIGAIGAVLGGGAGAEMMRYGGEFIGFMAGAVPGLILALMGFFGLVFAQFGRAGVDSAEYSQQSLQISREQLEVSRQSLRHGEEVKNGFASLKAQLVVPATASYAGQSGQTRDVAEVASQPVSGASYAKTINHNGRDIQQLAQGFRFAGMEFQTLDAARTYIDGLSTSPAPLLSGVSR
jgi:hypothetical protein